MIVETRNFHRTLILALSFTKRSSISQVINSYLKFSICLVYICFYVDIVRTVIPARFSVPAISKYYRGSFGTSLGGNVRISKDTEVCRS